jgi:putative NIF3 family GTP cyclohydrolase 1 type 2
MLFMKLLTNRAQMFADVRTYWSGDAVKKCTGYDLEGKALESDRVKVFANNKSVSRVAVCSGSGGSVLRDAYLAGADTLVTGEVKYNNELDAAEYGVNLIVAGHKETERIVLPVIKDIILKGFPSAEVFVYYA